jgi:hypothetical protein
VRSGNQKYTGGHKRQKSTDGQYDCSHMIQFIEKFPGRSTNWIPNFPHPGSLLKARTAWGKLSSA